MGAICKTCGRGSKRALDAVKGKSPPPPKASKKDLVSKILKKQPK